MYLFIILNIISNFENEHILRKILCFMSFTHLILHIYEYHSNFGNEHILRKILCFKSFTHLILHIYEYHSNFENEHILRKLLCSNSFTYLILHIYDYVMVLWPVQLAYIPVWDIWQTLFKTSPNVISNTENFIYPFCSLPFKT